MQRSRTITSLDVSAVAGHHAMPAELLLRYPVHTVMFHLLKEGHNPAITHPPEKERYGLANVLQTTPIQNFKTLAYTLHQLCDTA